MKKLGDFLMILGLLLITGALVLFIYNSAESARAGKTAEAAREALAETISQAEQVPYGSVPWNPGGWSGDGTVAPEMPVTEVNGVGYIGVLDFPSAGVSLPVMSEWSYDNLRTAPCRYTGSFYTDDAVVCGHNYTTHFGFLLSFGIGSDVYFTSMNGEVFHYIVANRETVRPTEIEKMTVPDGEWDLTLFTCDLDGRTRCAVRCVRTVN